MRRINYGNREKFIAEEEQPLARKRVNWDRIVYLVVLLILVGSLVLYLLDKYIYLSVSGQVVYKSHLVYLPNDSRIYDIYFEEDEMVEEGDTLFSYRAEINRTDNALFNSIQSAEASKERDLSDARRNLLVKQTEYNENLKLIASYQKKIEEIELMVLLDANSSERINSYQIEIDKLKSKNEVILAEIRYWQNYIANAPRRTSSYQNNLNARISDLNQFKVYISTVTGKIDRINYEVDELVYKGQQILDIVEDEIYAICYLREDDFGLLLEGDMVDVKFANGQKDKGVVKLIFANLENIPSRYLRIVSAPNDYMLVVIEPLDETGLEKWEVNVNQRIKVTKQRNF